MPQGRLIVHIGAPKCGSSSLQTALSRAPDFTSRTGERFLYAAIRSDGAVVAGRSLRHAAAASIHGYVASEDGRSIEALGPDRIAALAAELRAMLDETSVVLSNEGWFDRVGQFGRMGLLAAIGARVEIVVFARPQAGYLNASWWQWAAWSGIALDRWLAHLDARSCSWALMAYFWSRLDGVAAVHARLGTSDVVGPFFELLGCDDGASATVNRSLPPAALRLMQRHRELRPDAHASEIDFVLGRALADWPGRRPWVLPHDFVAGLIDACRQDNHALEAMLPPDQAARMAADPGWWDASAYAERVVEPAAAPPPEIGEIEAMAVALAKALHAAERELATARAAAFDRCGDD